MYYARRKKRRMQRRLRFLCAAVCILVLAGIITLIISLFDKKGKQDDSLEPEQTSGSVTLTGQELTVSLSRPEGTMPTWARPWPGRGLSPAGRKR